MRLLVKRKEFTKESTIGELYINDKFFCYTLEDVVRPENEPKVYGKTAIPKGKYDMIVNVSNRFKIKMPLLLKVSGFEGVRIHAGNNASNSEGCILVGMTKAKNFIGQSRIAFNDLMNALSKDNNYTIEIIEERPMIA